jgi:hypothetical protein
LGGWKAEEGIAAALSGRRFLRWIFSRQPGIFRIKRNAISGREQMTEQPKKDDWVYVTVESAGNSEGYAGYRDEPTNVFYIPAFYDKDAAQSCFINFPRERGKKYEVQAVLFEALVSDAAANGFLVFMLDKDGRVLMKIDPSAVAG